MRWCLVSQSSEKCTPSPQVMHPCTHQVPDCGVCVLAMSLVVNQRQRLGILSGPGAVLSSKTWTSFKLFTHVSQFHVLNQGRREMRERRREGPQGVRLLCVVMVKPVSGFHSSRGADSVVWLSSVL